jgi:hypothetical protein
MDPFIYVVKKTANTKVLTVFLLKKEPEPVVRHPLQAGAI